MLRANDRVPGPIYVGDNLDDHWEINQFKTKGDLKVLETLLLCKSCWMRFILSQE